MNDDGLSRHNIRQMYLQNIYLMMESEDQAVNDNSFLGEVLDQGSEDGKLVPNHGGHGSWIALILVPLADYDHTVVSNINCLLWKSTPLLLREPHY